MMKGTQLELKITHQGGLGDGIAEHDGKPVYVPLSCEGDVVRAEVRHIASDHLRASLLEVIEPSPHRQTPPCEHFGACGGCSLQHLEEALYMRVKQDIVMRVVQNLGVSDSAVQPMISVGAASRRRVELKVAVHKSAISLGFLAHKSHDVVDITSCMISDDKINALLQSLKACLEGMKKPGRVSSVHVTVLDDGLDILVGASSVLHRQDNEALLCFAKAHNIMRLSFMQDDKVHTLYGADQAIICFADVTLQLPVGAFLQASEAGQQAMTQLVVEHLQECEHVADLYAGCGTYSFPLVKHMQRVSAYEGAADMVAAQHNAILQHGLEACMSATVRDLYRGPLKASECNHYDGVVINPPRNGALPQMKQMANSAINKIALVSCNPTTFQRDAAILLDAGYFMSSITAIDQFYMSSHLEVVGCFTR